MLENEKWKIKNHIQSEGSTSAGVEVELLRAAREAQEGFWGEIHAVVLVARGALVCFGAAPHNYIH